MGKSTGCLATLDFMILTEAQVIPRSTEENYKSARPKDHESSYMPVLIDTLFAGMIGHEGSWTTLGKIALWPGAHIDNKTF